MSKETHVETKWIVSYGPLSMADRESRIVYSESEAIKLFRKYEEMNFHVDIIKQKITTEREKLTI